MPVGVPSTGADLVIVNASIRTMDRGEPRAQAVAIQGNRIVAVGSDAEIGACAKPGAEVIDAKKQLVLPGFNDAHVHFLMGGFSLANVELRSAESPAAIAQRLGEYCRRRPAGEWILGGDWDHEGWPGTPLPTRAMIDAATP